jgi:hypothetical protein
VVALAVQLEAQVFWECPFGLKGGRKHFRISTTA